MLSRVAMQLLSNKNARSLEVPNVSKGRGIKPPTRPSKRRYLGEKKERSYEEYIIAPRWVDVYYSAWENRCRQKERKEDSEDEEEEEEGPSRKKRNTDQRKGKKVVVPSMPELRNGLKRRLCEEDEPGDDEWAYSESLKNNHHVFSQRPNEVSVDNGSPLFHALRANKISASKVGAIAGLSKYDPPAIVALNFYVRFDDTVFTHNGRIEEPRTRLRNVVEAKHVALRKCGIFKDEWEPLSYTSMPDDMAAVLRVEFPLEDKYFEYPWDEKARPHADHLAQVTWQMATTSSSHAYLVYSLGHSHKIEGMNLVYWEVAFCPVFYRFLRERAAHFRLFIDNPCRETLPTDVPWLGGQRSDLKDWIDRKKSFEELLGIPSPPPFASVQAHQLGHFTLPSGMLLVNE